MTRKIGVIAAHPDDEILGCGATMAKHVANGDDVHVLILGEGALSRDDAKREQTSMLADAAKKANDIIGVKSLSLQPFPDNQMDTVALLNIVKEVEKFIAEHQINIVYTHHAGDVNVDHQQVHAAVITAARPLPKSTVSTILFFEVLSSTEWQTQSFNKPFLANWYEDVSEYLAVKLEALHAYESEMRDWPHARSYKAVEHLAHLRGANISVDAAEAFMLGRHVL